MENKPAPPDQIKVSQTANLWRAMAHGLGVTLAAMCLLLLGEAVLDVGPLVPIAVLLTALIAIINNLGYAELAANSSRPGGAYALVHANTGRSSLSFFTGWMLMLSCLGLGGVLIRGAASQLTRLLFNLLNISIPIGLLTTGLFTVLILESFLSRRDKQRVWFTLPLIVLLTLLILVAVPRLPEIEYTTQVPQSSLAITILMAAFVGVEIVATKQQRIRHPDVNLPRALLLTPALSALIGIGVALGVGPSLAVIPDAPLASLGSIIGGIVGESALLIIGVVILTLSASRMLKTSLHQAHAMGQDGFWPSRSWRSSSRHIIPPRIVLVVGLLALPLAWIPIRLLSQIASLLYLLVLMAVNITLIQRSRQDNAFSFTLPFHPWVPALTLAVDVLIFFLWESWPIVCVAAYLLIGLLIYLVYARQRHIAAKEGVTVFRPPSDEATSERFRVLVPLANPATATTLLRLAGRLAQFQGGDVAALQVITVPEPVPLEAGRRRAEAGRELLEKALTLAAEEKLPIQTMTRSARSVAQGITNTAIEENVDLIMLGWQGPSRSSSTSLGHIVDQVLKDAPCDVLVMQGEHDALPRKILVPTAGGPHAKAAARLAALMTKALQAKVTLIHVQPQPKTTQRTEENRRRIVETLEGSPMAHPAEQKVLTAPSVIEGIVEEAKGYDLVLIGVSDESTLDRIVFGSIPLQVAARTPTTALVQAHRGLTGLWTRRLLQFLQNTIPALNAEEQLAVKRELAQGAHPGTNFFVLIVLSSIIAALGLLLSSPAVVIGAMLVAPLMSPILAFSQGLVTGNLRMMRLSTEAILKGVALSIIVAAFVGLFSPLKGISEEMYARSHPDLLDMAVALASGMAGAYAIARKDVSAALPGVAIAAALMPPLATVGLSLSMGNARVASGAFLLFITNIAAISLAAGVVFLMLGIRPKDGGPDTHKQLRRRMAGSLLLLLAIAIPLSVILISAVQDTTQEQAIRDAIVQQLETSDGHLVDLEIERQEDDLRVIATVRTARPFTGETVKQIADVLNEQLSDPIQLEIVVLPIIRSSPLQTP